MKLYLIILTFILGLPMSTPSFAAAPGAILHGEIVDGANQPVNGAEVYLFDSANVKRPADFISNRTGRQGIFRIEIPAGRYWAVAIIRQSGKTFGPLGALDKHSGEPVEIDLTEARELRRDFTVRDLREAAKVNQKRSEEVIRVSGRIVTRDGVPVAMAFVMADRQVRSGGLPCYVSTWTGVGGEYVLYLPKGKYFVGTGKDFPPGDDYNLPHEATFDHDTEDVDLLISSSGPVTKD